MKTSRSLKTRIISLLLSLIFTLGTVQIPINAVGNEPKSLSVSSSDIGEADIASDTLEEDISLRDKYTKHYVSGDGKRYMVIFPEQVHYLEDDAWLEVNNTFSLDSVKNEYVSANSEFKTRFSKSAKSSRLVYIKDGDHSLSWSISFDSSDLKSTTTSIAPMEKAALQTATADSLARISSADSSEVGTVRSRETISNIGKAVSSVEYSNVSGSGVDLRYSIAHGKIEEDVILYSSDDITSYTMTVNTGGLAAVKNDDGSVSFLDETGEEIFNIDAPWMSDEAGNVSHSVDVSVIQSGNNALIKYTPSSEWLKSEERVFPVLIDPSITTRRYQSNYIDTYVYEDDTSPAARANETLLKIGNISGKRYYAYIKILNIPSLIEEFYINDAVFTFYTNTSSASLSLYGVHEAWDENTITYTTQPDSSSISTVSGTSFTNNLTKYTFDLTEWLNGSISGNETGVPFLQSENWNGFKIGYSGTTSSSTEIYSSDNSMPQVRPIMTIEYDYYHASGIIDDGIYRFKNSESEKYLTVCGGNTANGTNVIQSENVANSMSQAFRLNCDASTEGYMINSICSSNGYGSMLKIADIDNTVSDAGYQSQNVYLYEQKPEDYDENEEGAEQYTDTADWLFCLVSDGKYKILLRADPNLALTSIGTSSGTAAGIGTASPGNVIVSEFTGANNQLWVIESGGCDIATRLNIKENSNSFSISEGTSWLSFCCPIINFGDIVSWSSSNPYSSTVDVNGNVTAVSAGSSVIKATVTSSAGVETVHECTVYVTIANGVYYFNNAYNDLRLEYENTEGYSENSVLEAYDSGTNEPNERYQMFKIYYLGNGKYSIRSMLDSSMGWTRYGSKLVMTTIGTSTNDIPTLSIWRINTNANGYYICLHYDNAAVVTAPTSDDSDDNDIALQSYSSVNLKQNWSISPVAASYHGVTITASTNVLLAGKNTVFDAVMFSSYSAENGDKGIRWSVTNGTGRATINSSTGELIGISCGNVIVRATYISSSWHQDIAVYIVPLADGTYLFKNGEIGNYMQINNNANITDDNAFFELFPFDAEGDQRWNISFLNNGYYKIANYASNKVITAPADTGSKITQTDYSGIYTQQWKIIIVANGVYKLSPRSNESSYMAAGNSLISDPNGRNIWLKNNQEDAKDEWYIEIDSLRLPNNDAQNKTSWCWAASSKMVGEHNGGDGALRKGPALLDNQLNVHQLGDILFYGETHSGDKTVDSGQREIVVSIFGDDDNHGGNVNNMKDALEIASNSEMTITCYGYSDNIIAEINNELLNGRWVVCGAVCSDSRYSGNGSRHAIVLRSYSERTQKYTYWDPWTNLEGEITQSMIENNSFLLYSVIYSIECFLTCN